MLSEFYCTEEQAQLEKLPRCSCCDEWITSKFCFAINDELLCEACLIREHRKWTGDYIE